MTRISRKTAPLVLASAAIAGALALTACSGTADDADAADDGSLRVVATTTQLADFVSEVGAGDVSLTGLLHAGASAHAYDPTPADLLALAEADVLVVNGAGLETFVDDAIESSGFSGAIVTAADGIDLEAAEEITAEGGEDGHDHDHEDGHDHDDEADHDHDHADEEGADHDHGDLNPHIWTSPRNAEGMVAAIADGLAEADPARADDYASRAEAYTARLQDLDGWVAEQFAQVPESDRVLVSGHDSLRYYLHDYGIAFAGSILPSFEDNAEPSAADIDDLVAEIEEHGVRAVFVESSMSPKLARTIAKEAGIEVVDAESLYADSLGVAGSGADSYIDATIANTRTILGAWGYDTEALPDSLQ